MLKATKACFPAIVEVSGIVRAREETAVRPERLGLKVIDILADAGDTVTAGQTLARLSLPEGGTVQVQAPVAGLIASSTAVIGAIASGRGEALFSIIARSEFDLIAVVPTRDLGKLKVNQTARIKVVGAPEVDGKVTRVSPTVQPDSQLGQVTLAVTSNQRLLVNSSGRALIKTSQSCGVAVPLTAVLYGTAGTVVQVVRRARVETRRVEVGLDVRRPGRDPRRPAGRRHGGRPRRRHPARRRSGAPGDGERGQVGISGSRPCERRDPYAVSPR